MRIAKVALAFALALLAAGALSGCIFHTRTQAPSGHPGGPPPGHGWKK